MKNFMVCGTFDNHGGKSSTVAEHLFEGLKEHLEDIKCFNGGYLNTIPLFLDNLAPKAEVILWFPNISNEVETKFVDRIKRENHTCTLVISKRNDNDQYSFADLVQRMLTKRANLFVEIKKGERIMGRVLDPLGNMFLDWSEDFVKIGRVLGKRIEQVRRFRRVKSVKLNDMVEVPENKEFFSLIREAAVKFHDLVPSVANPSRFLGNASFRCTMGGFPSFRGEGNTIYVSKRNVDKREISRESFVPIKLNRLILCSSSEMVWYCGDHKPSVDTPIQVALYNYYHKVNYILHGHVYLKGFPFTNKPITCGALDEYYEIRGKMPSQDYTFFGLNLLGHGFILLSEDIKSIKKSLEHCVSRPAPENLEGAVK